MKSCSYFFNKKKNEKEIKKLERECLCVYVRLCMFPVSNTKTETLAFVLILKGKMVLISVILYFGSEDR